VGALSILAARELKARPASGAHELPIIGPEPAIVACAGEFAHGPPLNRASFARSISLPRKGRIYFQFQYQVNAQESRVEVLKAA
jgi:hypothetical protein